MKEEYRIERELSGATPRRIERRTASCVGCMYFLFLIYVIVGVGLLTLAVGKTLVAYKGITMPAKVTSREDTSDSDGASYRVDYTYEYREIEYSGSSQISKDDYDGMETGRPLAVRALSSAPDFLPVLQDYDLSETALFWLIWFGAGLWWALTPSLIWSVFTWPRIVRRLIREGAPIAARVTDKTSRTDDGVTSYTLHYEFTQHNTDRAVVAGKIAITKEQWESISVGGAVTALYDPARPKHHVLYQWAPYRAIETSP